MIPAPHNYFGRMELDEQRRSYRATVGFSPTHKVSVVIDWTGIAPAEALKRAQDICERIWLRETEFRGNIAHELLRLYNESWRNGPKLEAEKFMSRILLTEMQIAPADYGSAGCASLYYSDGELFGGHSIEVFLDADFNFKKAKLIG